ncbi:MAG: S8 family serine peptidase, partial [Phycisphaerae bacterium]
VAATGDTDVRADFSNFGTHVSLCAPGVALASTDTVNGYHAASGTSFSAPLVSGTLALLGRSDPGASADSLRAALLGTTDVIDALNPGFEGQLGSGRLDAAAAVRSPLLCRGDLNLDRRVSLLDLSALLSGFGKSSGATFAEGDITGDGAVRLEDLTLLLSAFGRICE